jgi:lysozyme
MQVSEQGLNLIKAFEGFRSAPYRCPGGYQTIGYGHVIKPYETWETITEDDAYLLLCKDVGIASRAVHRLIHVPLNQNQFDALTSFTFNMGTGVLQRSTVRSCVNRGEHDVVPYELMKWVRAGGRIVPGLVKRRGIEARLYTC